MTEETELRFDPTGFILTPDNGPNWRPMYHEWIDNTPVFKDAELFHTFSALLRLSRAKAGMVKLANGTKVFVDVDEAIVHEAYIGEWLDKPLSKVAQQMQELEAIGVISLDRSNAGYTKVTLAFPSTEHRRSYDQ